MIIQDEMETGESGDIIGYSTINETFHNFVARISKNPYLQQYSQYVFWRTNSYIFFRYYQFKVSMSFQEGLRTLFGIVNIIISTPRDSL